MSPVLRLVGSSLLSFVAACAGLPTPEQQGVEPEKGSLTLLAVSQDYGSDWNPHDEYGSVELDFQVPVSDILDVQVALQYSEQSRDEIEALENDVGLRLRVVKSPATLVPYVGAGVAFVGVRERVGRDDVDVTQGLYLRGGVEWRFSESVFLELDVKATRAGELDLERERDLSYVQVGLGMGVRF